MSSPFSLRFPQPLASSANKANIAHQAELEQERVLVGKTGGKVWDGGEEENGTLRPHEVKDIRLRFREGRTFEECLAGSIGIFGCPSQVVFHIHRC